MNIEEFRNGIFSLRTRRFGDVAEIMIKKLYNLENSRTLKYDKYDSKNKERIEVKFSTVMKENGTKITEDSLIEECLKANITNRAMKFSDIKNNKFDCNIQQIKCKEFDVLYYGLFFADKILIFKIASEDIIKHKIYIKYSNKQHRGNEGEGQFHINKDTLQYHMDNFFQQKITYKKLYNLFK